MLLFQFLSFKNILTCKRLLLKQMNLLWPTMAHHGPSYLWQRVFIPNFGQVFHPETDRRHSACAQPTRDENEYDASKRVQRKDERCFQQAELPKNKRYLLILLISLAVT